MLLPLPGDVKSRGGMKNQFNHLVTTSASRRWAQKQRFPVLALRRVRPSIPAIRANFTVPI